MEQHEGLEKGIARKSARIYLPVAIGAGLSFFLIASATGAPLVARVGGAVWVGLLSLIVSMPIVIPRVKRSFRTGGSEDG